MDQKEVDLLERQRDEYARMARKLAEKSSNDPLRLTVEKRLKSIEDRLAEAASGSQKSKVWRRRPSRFYTGAQQTNDIATETTELGESVLRKYSVTATAIKDEGNSVTSPSQKPAANAETAKRGVVPAVFEGGKRRRQVSNDSSP